MNAVLIYNPYSRRVTREPDRVEKARRLLQQRGIAVEPWPTRQAGHGTALARQAVQESKDLVIACGGDGTIHEVVNGLAETTTPLGIIPGGTANVLADELQIPLDLTSAVDRIVNGTSKRIALGKAGSRYFHTMAGIGLDASIVNSVNPKLKDAMGVGGFWIEGLKHIYSYRMPVFDVRVNGKQFQATWVVASNVKKYGGRFRITPRADIMEGILDVCIFTTRSKLRYMAYVPLAYPGWHVQDSRIGYEKAERIEVTGDAAVGVQADGEWIGTLPCTVQVVPKALTIIL